MLPLKHLASEVGHCGCHMVDPILNHCFSKWLTPLFTLVLRAVQDQTSSSREFWSLKAEYMVVKNPSHIALAAAATVPQSSLLCSSMCQRCLKRWSGRLPETFKR